MRQGETCYFCTSTFQLLSILALAKTRKEPSDLYIDPQFRNAKEIANRIEKIGIFDKITIIDSDLIYNKYFHHRKGFLNHMEIAKSYYFVDKIAEMILKEKVKYRNIFISSKAYIPRMVVFNHIKHNYDVTINYFDDGVGSYYDNSAYKPKRTDAIVRFILFGRKSLDFCTDIYLFSPELYKSLNYDTKTRVHKIERIWEQVGWHEKLNYIFDVSVRNGIRKKVIILDEPIEDILSVDDTNRIFEIYHKLFDAFKMDCLIKKHPRSERPSDNHFRYYVDFGIPFELICMNEDIENSILVSYGSTAAATPKTLLDKEPIIIMLYKLVSNDNDVLRRYFPAVRETYTEKEKVYIPESQEEFDTIIRYLTER